MLSFLELKYFRTRLLYCYKIQKKGVINAAEQIYNTFFCMCDIAWNIVQTDVCFI